jgi:hypothetical protein
MRLSPPRTALPAALLAAAALGRVASAQQPSVELHSIYQRTNDSHQSSYGGGGDYGLSFGHGAVQLSTDAGVDYQAQEGDGQQQLGGSLDAAVQFGGGSAALTPYVGGSVSANWLAGGDRAFGDGPLLGLEYVVGIGVPLDRRGQTSLHVELRPGYVHTQAHYVSGQIGISTSP